MHVTNQFIVLGTLLSTASAACTVKGQRKAWHTFTNTEKLAYIDAEKCLMSKPPKVGLNGCKSLFDELQANHQIQAPITHGVGAFLPYHRYLMHVHEQFLRSECGYNGYQPYWEETIDAGKFTSSVVFDTVYGFGGNGRSGDRCITNGPFVNYTNSLGPGYQISNHCIDREINDSVSKGSSQAEVSKCTATTSFGAVWPCIEASPHVGGHFGTGREMSNPISSPGDPLFYLHHTWLDKLWWDWQAGSLPARLSDISGTNKPGNSFPGTPGASCTGGASACNSPITKSSGDPGDTTTLKHVLSSLGLIPNATIADVMDIRGDYLCYEYV